MRYFLVKINEQLLDTQKFETNYLSKFKDDDSEQLIISYFEYLLLNLNGEGKGLYINLENEERDYVFYQNGNKAFLIFEEISESDYIVLYKYIQELPSSKESD